MALDIQTLALAKSYTEESLAKISGEEISTVVEEYLTEHPVTAGATEEEHDMIIENRSNRISIGYSGSSVIFTKGVNE